MGLVLFFWSNKSEVSLLQAKIQIYLKNIWMDATEWAIEQMEHYLFYTKQWKWKYFG